MPFITVPATGSTFSYLDSGKPGDHGDTYTTLILIHGQTFHSAIFGRLFPHASSKGLRLICPNRRDYLGSSLYTEMELSSLQRGKEEELTQFLAQRGIELALLLTAFIDTLDLPPPGENSGIHLLGWSSGCTDPLLLLEHAAEIPAPTKKKLDLYLRSIFLLDPPFVAFGLDMPNGGYFPLFDPEIPASEKGWRFMKWVSTYFEHGNLNAKDPSMLEYRPSANRPSTVARLTEEELASLVDRAPSQRSEMPIFTRCKPILNRLTRHAVCSEVVRAAWPQLSIWYLSGAQSSGLAVSTAWEIENWVRNSDGLKIKFLELPGANHFVFWEQPDNFLQLLEKCINEP